MYMAKVWWVVSSGMGHPIHNMGSTSYVILTSYMYRGQCVHILNISMNTNLYYLLYVHDLNLYITLQPNVSIP